MSGIAIWAKIFLTIMGARWLGHGRKMEFGLIMITGSYGLSLVVFGPAPFANQATLDLAFQGYGSLLAIPLLLKFVLSGYGLLANINAWPLSRQSRFLGGFVGAWVWVWFVAKFILIGQYLTFGSFCAFWFAFFSIQIMAAALADLPRPGAPGAL